MLEFLSISNELIVGSTLLTRLIHSRSLTHGRRLIYQLASQQELIGVKYVIDRGILDFTDPETLLHGAVRSQSVHVLETLLHLGFGPDAKDSMRRTPLGLAAKYGRVDFMRVLAMREDVDVNWEDNKSVTPLFHAVQAGQEEVVRILVQSAKVDLHYVSEYRCGNCLHLAAGGDCVPILRFLLDYMDPNGEDDYGNTAVHIAAGTGNWPAVECLLGDQRLDINAPNINGRTILHFAILAEKHDIVKILLADARIEINKCDIHGPTPRDMPVTESSLEAVRLILSLPEAHVSITFSGSSPYPCCIEGLFLFWTTEAARDFWMLEILLRGLDED